MNMTATNHAAPVRSEAFFEDLANSPDEIGVELPWTLRQAGFAALLCAVPVAVATMGGLLSLVAGG